MFLSVCFSYPFFFHLDTDLYLFLHVVDIRDDTSPTEESGPLAEFTPLTGYEPKLPDDFHFSETTEIFIQESSSDTEPSYLHDAEIDDDTIGIALSSPLFTQEREEYPGIEWELLSLNEVRLIVLLKEMNNFDEINNFFMNKYQNKIENFVKLM